MFARDQAHFELAPQLRCGSCGEKNRVQEDVNRAHHQRPGKKRARDIFFWSLDFAYDVGGCVPARVGIHHINERDSERRAKDRHRIAARWQKRDWLLGTTKSPAPMRTAIKSNFTSVERF